MVAHGPPPSATPSGVLLSHAAEQALSSLLPDTAIFLSERLACVQPGPSSAILLARSYLSASSPARAAAALSPHLRAPGVSDEVRYLYAAAIFHSTANDEKLTEAETVLRRGRLGSGSGASAGVSGEVDPPGGAAGCFLLGKLCQRTARKEEAARFYRRALALNPLLWGAAEALAGMGLVSSATAVLGAHDDEAAALLLGRQPRFQGMRKDFGGGGVENANAGVRAATKSENNRSAEGAAPVEDPKTGTLFDTSGLLASESAVEVAMEVETPIRGGATAPPCTPAAGAGSQRRPRAKYTTPSPAPSATPVMPGAPPRKGMGGGAGGGAAGGSSVSVGRGGTARAARASANVANGDEGGSETPARFGGGGAGAPTHGAGDVRRSARLFSTPDNRNASAVSRVLGATGAVNTPQTRHGSSGLGLGGRDNMAVTPAAEDQRSGGAESRHLGAVATGSELSMVHGSSVMDALRGIVQAVGALGRYKCTAAIGHASRLPIVHRETGFVYAVVGRAYLEVGDYVGAATAFRTAMRLDPIRLDGIVEYYSTVLWHLKKEADLAELAIHAFNTDRHTAATWCAVGNCYSSQRDPDMALRYFKRAARVNPLNAYAHTLAGHEYVVKEDFDAALASYRQALHIDERHYNALYGIGQVLQKQEKFSLAERHFRAALRVHPENSNLHYHLGVALAASLSASASSGTNRAGGDPSRSLSKSSLSPALKELETATAIDPRNPVPKFERAKLLMQMDRLSDARVLLENLRDTLPREAAVFHELGKVCKRMGDRKAALRCFNSALDLDPKDQGRRYKKAIDTLYSTGDGDDL